MTTKEAGRRGGLARAAKIAAGLIVSKGRKKVPRLCPVCGKKQPGALEARNHHKDTGCEPRAPRDKIEVPKEAK